MSTSHFETNLSTSFIRSCFVERSKQIGMLAAAVLAAGGALIVAELVPQQQVDRSMRHNRHDTSPQMSAGDRTLIAGARPTTTVRPLSCQKLSDMPGKSLTLVLVDYPPNAYTPRHRHPGTVSAFVVKGVLRSQLSGGSVGTYKAGETWFEPPGAIHLFAENTSKTEPAEILATFITDDECGPLVIPD